MNICVFCGSGTGKNSVYADAARELGVLLSHHGHTLIYGGGNIGLMGILADSVLAHGGHAIGVIPDFLMQKEVGHTGLTQLEIVPNMHLRKHRMVELSHAFLVLPGGWGTLDETAEILTWKQLNLIQHPVGLININGFFDSLLEQMRQMVKEGFLKAENLQSLKTGSSSAEVLKQIIP